VADRLPANVLPPSRHQGVGLPEPGGRLHAQLHRRPRHRRLLPGRPDRRRRHHRHHPAARGAARDRGLRHPHPVRLH